MGLNPSGVLTAGTHLPKENANTWFHITLLVIPSWSRKQQLMDGSQKGITLGHIPSNKSSTRHYVHTNTLGHRRYGSAEHNQGRCSALKAANVEVFRKLNPKEGGC